MKLTRKKQCPQASDGPHLATLADVENLGVQSTAYGDRHNLRLLFVIDEYDEQGEPIYVSLIATASAHEDAKLTGFVRVLLGDEADEDVETEDLVGRSCWLKTKQQANAKGKIFAQIIGKRALKSEEEGPPVPIDFVRSENRPARKQRSAKVNGGTKPFVNVHGVTVSDEDVAFPGKH